MENKKNAEEAFAEMASATPANPLTVEQAKRDIAAIGVTGDEAESVLESGESIGVVKA